MKRNSARTWLIENVPQAGDECLVAPNLQPTRKGYTRLNLGERNVMAHRFVYETFVGPIPEGLEIDHTCNNRACCNPKHLQLLTHAENTREVVRRGRHYWANLTHCRRSGHPLSGDNVHVNERGHRRCKACMQGANRRYQQRLKAVAGAAVVAGAVMALPSVGLTHHSIIDVDTVCTDGGWQAVYTVSADADRPLTWSVNSQPAQPDEVPFVFTIPKTLADTTDTFHASAVWSNGATDSDDATATQPAGCTPTTTTSTVASTTTTSTGVPTSTTTLPATTTSTTTLPAETTTVPSSTTTTTVSPSTTVTPTTVPPTEPTTTTEPSTTTSVASTTTPPPSSTSPATTSPPSSSTTPTTTPPSVPSTTLPPPSSTTPPPPTTVPSGDCSSTSSTTPSTDPPATPCERPLLPATR